MFNEWNPIPKPSHGRRVKKRGDRSKFSKMVRDAVKDHYSNQCGQCGRNACHVHHVMPRSRGGRNVFTNGLLLCNDCHKQVHADNDLLKEWINRYKKMYGKNFYKDYEDLKQEYDNQLLTASNKELREWERHNGSFNLTV